MLFKSFVKLTSSTMNNFLQSYAYLNRTARIALAAPGLIGNRLLPIQVQEFHHQRIFVYSHTYWNCCTASNSSYVNTMQLISNYMFNWLAKSKLGDRVAHLNSKSPPCFSRQILFGNTCVKKRLCSNSTDGVLESVPFEILAEETLLKLCDFFEQLGDDEDVSSDYDVTFSSGVLTVVFGPPHGTYVINKQTPNQQIWLSSPTSGPKRYDMVNNEWVYSHDNNTLSNLLSDEISNIIGKDLDFYEVIKTTHT